MAKKAEDYIPPNILAAAQAEGLDVPLWYVGRRHDPNHVVKSGFGKVIREDRAQRGLPPREPQSSETPIAETPPQVEPLPIPEAQE